MSGAGQVDHSPKVHLVGLTTKPYVRVAVVVCNVPWVAGRVSWGDSGWICPWIPYNLRPALNLPSFHITNGMPTCRMNRNDQEKVFKMLILYYLFFFDIGWDYLFVCLFVIGSKFRANSRSENSACDFLKIVILSKLLGAKQVICVLHKIWDMLGYGAC